MKKLLLLIFSFLSLFAIEKDYKVGEKIYKTTCISCHGVDGKADEKLHLVVMPRSLQKSLLNEEQNYQVIKKGTHFWGSSADIMPSFESTYNEYELRSIAYYIIKKFNPNVEQKVKDLYAKSEIVPQEKRSKMLKRGKKIYKRNCSWCHGLTAMGDGAATRNPEKSIFPYNLEKTLLSSEQMFLYAKYGGKFFGTHKDDMPGWSRKYDDFTLKSVIRYIDEEFRGNR
ncbi:MAG: c-type cytochrome [Campylobacterota bacterium]|nr:c-type cytochrome [Campylobacterota bacterium]